MPNNDHILIIGAGLCGSLLALRLGQLGYQVSVKEKRPDLRKEDISAGRSINLAFSDRGEKAIKMVDLIDKVKQLCIPMNGRMIHDREGNTFLSPYSGRDNEYINSISREGLNALLLDEAEALDNVTIDFDIACTDVDFVNKQASFRRTGAENIEVLNADIIMGTDGAGSILRRSYFGSRKFLFNFSQEYLTHGYKELSIRANPDGGYKAHANALHIWPRGEFMVIALPNLDGSFTVTLFLAYEGGEYNFNNLTDEKIVLEFFQKEFPDALALMPNLVEDFFANPTAPLGTVRCSPWEYKGNTLILGDAAHAIVPFYGQGMNASFEDVVELDKSIEKYKGDWDQIFAHFASNRKKDTDAIGDLALDNFHEMQSHTANPLFQEKRKVEMLLESEFPEEYFSKYSLVTFNGRIGYNEAMVKGRAQDKAIIRLLKNEKINLETNLRQLMAQVQYETNKILEEDELF